jgi:hypothetical protein
LLAADAGPATTISPPAWLLVARRLLHAAPYDPVEVVPDPLVVNRDDIVQ